MWEYLKEKAYNTTVDSIEDIKSRIRRECSRIRPSVSSKVWDNVKLRLNVLENHDGRRIENFKRQ